MVFAAPIALLLSFPWLVVTVWLMSRRGRDAAVPFIHLWPNQSPAMGSSFRPAKLPRWVVLILVSAAAGIVAAARPMVGARIERPVTLIVDRGVTMSAEAADGRRRLLQAVEELAASIDELQLTPRKLVIVPSDGIDVSSADWLRQLQILAPSAANTGDLLHTACEDVLRADSQPVLVVTDQPLRVDSDNQGRVAIIHPGAPLENYGIIHAAASVAPLSQVLVRVRNQRSSPATLMLTVTSQGASAERPVALSPNEQRDEFVDLPALGEVVHLQLTPADAIKADDSAWLVRGAAWPRLVPRGRLPPELMRFIEIYSRHRPPDASSPTVIVAKGGQEIPASQQAVILHEGTKAVGNVEEAIEVSGRIGHNINWPKALAGARVGPLPGEAWHALVRVAGEPIVAQRHTPARQVLLNFWSTDFAHEPEFVILLTDVFDSFAQQANTFSSEPLFIPPSSWRLTTPPVGAYQPSPGVYSDASGRQCALNAIDVSLPPAQAQEWKSAAQRFPSTPSAGIDFTAPGAIASALALLFGLWLLPRKSISARSRTTSAA